MQGEPLYDFPDPQPPALKCAGPQRGSLRSVSVLDRLLLTHPVWLQLSINSATALHILQREPPGTFLVRKSSTSQKKVLCVRLADDSIPSFVKQLVIRELDCTFSLESAAISFPDLCRLIAFYCVSRDVLPFTLELPVAIAKATSHKQLESISHMGVEFWNSQLNFRGPRGGASEEKAMPPLPSPEYCSTPQGSPTLFQEFCTIRTRSPRELNYGHEQGALCFINPLFLQSQDAVHRRHQFKRSLKVRVSTETSGPLSPPVASPPPPPLLAKTKGRGFRGGNGGQKTPLAVGSNEGKRGMTVEGVRGETVEGTPCTDPQTASSTKCFQPVPVLPPKKKTSLMPPTLSPTTEEDYHIPPTLSPTTEQDYHIPKMLLKGGEGGGRGGGTEGRGEEEGGGEGGGGKEGTQNEIEIELAETSRVQREKSEERDEEAEPGQEQEEEVLLCVTQENRLAPSLSELESCSSLSSLEEAVESPQRPPFTRGSSNPAPPRQPGSALRKLSAAFVSFFVPGRRVARIVEDLAVDRQTAFGALVQDFLRLQREEELKPNSQSDAVELLQKLRLFLSSAKSFLLDSGELEPPIETLVPEEEIDVVLEKALYRCVLKPLQPQLNATLQTLQQRDGSAPNLERCLRLAREGNPEEQFGVGGDVAAAVAAGLEKVKRKLRVLRRAYSPLDKMTLLLQVCKLVYSTMRSSSAPGRDFGADDFLPVLSYFLVQVNQPEVLTEVIYMMELLDPAYLTGEGGYYLTSVYASLCLIQSDSTPPGGVTREARQSLKAWSRRRSNEAQQHQHQQRCVRVLFRTDQISDLRTVQWKSEVSVDQLTQVCASCFLVDQPGLYQLYWRRDGLLQPLPVNAHIKDLQGQGCSGTPLLYQRIGSSQQEMQGSGNVPLLTRGGVEDQED
ncbi:ras and Rab interactor 1 [Osmerus mordax]|uniref:ras and Rab interactor 1 n=1 Tax=Osmerus mordax TaxID=8014 RepID=UPI00350FD331